MACFITRTIQQLPGCQENQRDDQCKMSICIQLSKMTHSVLASLQGPTTAQHIDPGTKETDVQGTEPIQPFQSAPRRPLVYCWAKKKDTLPTQSILQIATH